MPVVECGGCNRKYRVGDELAGKKVKCKSCGKAMLVPGVSGGGTNATVASAQPPAARAVAPPALPSQAPVDIDALFAGGPDLHFKDDDAPAPAAATPPPVQHNPGHTTSTGRKLSLSASATGTGSAASSAGEPSTATVRLPAPPPPIAAASRMNVAPLGYATPIPAGPIASAPIARPRFNSVHGQPAVGLDGVSPMLLLLFFVSGVIVMIIMTIQITQIADEPGVDTIPISVIWTGGFAYMAALFIILGPLVWLAMFITSKIFSFRLGDVPYLRSCGVAAIPGVVMFISVIMIFSKANPFFLILLGCAVVPLTYLIIRGVFYMSWGAAAVGFVFTGIFQTIGNFIAFFLVVTMMAGSMIGAEKAKRDAARAERARQQQEQLAAVAEANRKAPASVSTPATPNSTTPTPASPVVDVLASIPDEQMPRVPERKALQESAFGLYRWLDNYNETVDDDYMFRAPKGFVRGMSSPGTMRMVGGGYRDLRNSRGEGYSEPNFTIIASMNVAVRKPADVQGKRRTELQDGDRTIISVFDAFELRGVKHYQAEHYVFTERGVVQFKVESIEPFSHSLHGSLAMTPLTLTKLDYYAQARGDLESDDESLQADAIERLAKRPPTQDRDDYIRLVQPFLEKDSTRKNALRLLGMLLPRQEASKLVLGALADEKRRWESTETAVAVLVAHNDKEQIPHLVEALRHLSSNEALTKALAGHGKDAHPHLLALLEEDPNQYHDRVLDILEQAPSKTILPAMKSLSTSSNAALRKRARDLANRVEPGTFDALDEVLSELKLASTFEKQDLLARLDRIPVKDDRRAEVTAALIQMIEETHFNLPEPVVPLLVKWRDDQTVPTLIGMLGPKADDVERQSAMAALGMIKDPRGIVPITRWLIKDGQAASAALKQYGSVVEKDIIGLLDEKSVTARVNACHILGAVGTDKSVGPLGALTRSRDNAVAIAASVALDQLKARLDSAAPAPAEDPAPQPAQ